GDLLTLVCPAPQLLVGSVRDDPVEPRCEGGVASEGVDVPHHAPERVLNDLLRILRIPGDTGRQSISTIAVVRNKALRRRPISPPQCCEEFTVAIDPCRNRGSLNRNRSVDRKGWGQTVHGLSPD